MGSRVGPAVMSSFKALLGGLISGFIGSFLGGLLGLDASEIARLKKENII